MCKSNTSISGAAAGGFVAFDFHSAAHLVFARTLISSIGLQEALVLSTCDQVNLFFRTHPLSALNRAMTHQKRWSNTNKKAQLVTITGNYEHKPEPFLSDEPCFYGVWVGRYVRDVSSPLGLENRGRQRGCYFHKYFL
jgi:hypothetical protein